jgi:CspA family cold shock protein
MSEGDVYWPYVGFAVAGLAALPALYFFFQRRWSWLALLVALANLVIVLINGAAPVRGAIDPNYVGYGFIEPEDGSKDAFVHISAVEKAGLQSLREGQKVQFDLVPGRTGKKSAENLTVLD